MFLPFHQRTTQARRGTVMLLAVIAIAFAMVAGLAFLAASSTAVGIATIVDERAQARQTAEGGVALTVEYMRRVPDWRDHHPSGVWTSALEVLDGQAQVSVSYPQAALESTLIADASFEQEVASSPTPILNPPASAGIGGWEFSRSALVVTGATVPTMGTRASATATDGANQAFAGFTVSVQGGVVIGQSLTAQLKPHTAYEGSVDIEVSGLGPAASEVGFRVLAGAVLVASTANAATLADGLSTQAIQDAAEHLQGAAQEPATLVTTLLQGTTSRYTLRFVTDSQPPAGALRIELFASATAVLRTVEFDNVQLKERSNAPAIVSVVAQCGNASHRAQALVRYDISGSPRIVGWREP